MGVDIIAVSRAVPIPCKGDDACDETHFAVGSYRKRREGLKPGCYVTGKGGRDFGFRAGSYSGYSDWRKTLCLLALGVLPEEVWEHPRRFRGKPFVELIDFPDGVGPVIGPKTSAKLHSDFVAFAAKSKKYYAHPTPLESSVPTPKKGKAAKKHYINEAGLEDAQRAAEALGGTLPTIDLDNLGWMQEVYDDFRKAFKIASDGGFVMFC
jgi:hypothetical protein